MGDVRLLEQDCSPALRDAMLELLAPAIAASGGRASVDVLRGELERAEAQAWVAMEEGVWRGIVVTRVRRYPSGMRVLEVSYAVGQLADVPWVYWVLEAAAAELGVDGIEVVGRPGWGRVLREYGYRVASVRLFKEMS